MKENPNLSTSDIENTSEFYLLWSGDKRISIYNWSNEYDSSWVLLNLQILSILTLLNENIRDIEDKDRFDIVLANPPFGGKEDSNVQQNFQLNHQRQHLFFIIW